MPTLPFDEIDVLMVDRQGKNIPGSGMDTNVIRKRVYGFEPAPETLIITRIFVRGLTPPSHGNANGVGSADVIHASLYEKIDLEDTFVDALTSSAPRGVRIPTPVETDRAGIAACLSTIGVTSSEEASVVHIRDTIHLEHVAISSPLVEEARDRDDLEVVTDPEAMAFDDDGQFERDLPEIYGICRCSVL